MRENQSKQKLSTLSTHRTEKKQLPFFSYWSNISCLVNALLCYKYFSRQEQHEHEQKEEKKYDIDSRARDKSDSHFSFVT